MYLNIFLMVAAGIFYYRLGQREYGQGFFSAGLSIAVAVVTQIALGWGLIGFAAGQLGLLVGMTIYNMRRHDAK